MTTVFVVLCLDATFYVLLSVADLLRLTACLFSSLVFFFIDTPPTEIYTLHIVGSVRCV